MSGPRPCDGGSHSAAPGPHDRRRRSGRRGPQLRGGATRGRNSSAERPPPDPVVARGRGGRCALSAGLGGRGRRRRLVRHDSASRRTHGVRRRGRCRQGRSGCLDDGADAKRHARARPRLVRPHPDRRSAQPTPRRLVRGALRDHGADGGRPEHVRSRGRLGGPPASDHRHARRSQHDTRRRWGGCLYVWIPTLRTHELARSTTV